MICRRFGWLVYFVDIQLNATSSAEALFRFQKRILWLSTFALAILFFKTTEPFTDTDNLLFFPSLLHSIDVGRFAPAVDLEVLAASPLQKESNAFSFRGEGAHQGASKMPYALSSKVVPGMTGAHKPLFVKTSLETKDARLSYTCSRKFILGANKRKCIRNVSYSATIN